jgi:hypothetical protein
MSLKTKEISNSFMNVMEKASKTSRPNSYYIGHNTVHIVDLKTFKSFSHSYNANIALVHIEYVV